MLNTLFVVPKAKIDNNQLMSIRKLTGAALSQIKQAAEHQQPIWQLDEVFAGTWEQDKQFLVTLYQQLPTGAYRLYDGEELAEATLLDAASFYQRLKLLREIELEQALQTALETGEIDSEDEFVADEDDNWLPAPPANAGAAAPDATNP
ncbi:hypothetical protein [Shewanella sp.]|uniref:hypothetical protein n=1 Tax=Shewanella sp. TaxID=50422 RepID=UPI003A976C0E